MKIAEIAKSVGAYVLADEVYRGISEDGSYMASITDVYEREFPWEACQRYSPLQDLEWVG